MDSERLSGLPLGWLRLRQLLIMVLQRTRRSPSKLDTLRGIIKGYGSVLVAYSGGVDSSFLVAVAHDVLPAGSLAVTARSPSLTATDLVQAVEQAAQLGWRHRVVDTVELEDPRYLANNSRRCFFCKTELYTKLKGIAAAEDLDEIANGSNVDDLNDYRPGLDAARQFGVRSPLVEAGMTKDDIRTFARELGLRTWDKPAQSCLSSRVPYGSEISIEALNQIAQAEDSLRHMGFRQVRVRHHGNMARIEIPVEDIQRIAEPHVRHEVNELLKASGYVYVALDLTGYRSGSMNDTLAPSMGSRHMRASSEN